MGGKLEELRANLERGLVAGVEGQPAAPAVLQSCASRVDELGGAVAQLCAHMETMRVKEVPNPNPNLNPNLWHCP